MPKKKTLGSSIVKVSGEKEKVFGTISSRSPMPREIRIDGRWLLLAPRGKISNVEQSQVGELPRGVFFYPMKKERE